MPRARRQARRGAQAEAGVPRSTWALVVGVTAAAAATVAVTLPEGAHLVLAAPQSLWKPLLYTAGLVVGELFMISLPFRRQRYTVGLVDGVVTIGLFYLPAAVLIPATALGTGVSQLASSTISEGVKRVFNISQYTLSAAAAAVVANLAMHGDTASGFPLTTLLGRPPTDIGLRWPLAVLLGMFAFFLVNDALVMLVIELSAGRERVVSWTRATPVLLANWAANTSYALVAAIVLLTEPVLLPLLLIPLALTLFGNRAWARSIAQGQRMRWLYSAGRALSRRLGDVSSWAAFVDTTKQIMNCEGAAVFLGRPEDEALDVVTTDEGATRLSAKPAPSAWELAARAYAADARWPRTTLVPMEAEDRILGYVAAYGPRVAAGLTAEDRETLATLANQAATTLLNETLYREAESERETLQDIVGHSSDGIYTVGPDRTVLSWNPAMASLTGYEAGEAIGHKCFNLLRARDGRGLDMCANDCPIFLAAQAGQEVVRDASVLTKDGVVRWIRYAHTPIAGGDGGMESDVVVVRDLTRERETDELKADFVASVSHELRTPLTPIKGFLLTLLRGEANFDEAQRREIYQLMLSGADRLEALVEQLLEVTRLEGGLPLLEPISVDASRLVNRVVDRFAVEHTERVLRVSGTAGRSYVRGDELRIEQVLEHLISNALRYAPPDEPVEVRLLARDREVLFEVHDRGPGIPFDEQQRIFERFRRGGHYLTRDPGGAGLGLYLAKRLVEAMGGRIWVTSHVGHGSVFCFALPAEPSLDELSAPR